MVGFRFDPSIFEVRQILLQSLREDPEPSSLIVAELLTRRDAQLETHLGRIIPVVTSTTHPASPFEGMLIYESDTNAFFAWDGSAWLKVWPSSVMTRTAGLAVTTSGTAESTVFTANVAAQGYPYRVHVRAVVFHTQTVAGDSFSLAVKLSSTIVGLTRGQASVETLIADDHIVVAGGGAITVNVVLARAAGTGTASTFVDGTSNYVTMWLEPA